MYTCQIIIDKDGQRRSNYSRIMIVETKNKNEAHIIRLPSLTVLTYLIAKTSQLSNGIRYMGTKKGMTSPIA